MALSPWRSPLSRPGTSWTSTTVTPLTMRCPSWRGLSGSRRSCSSYCESSSCWGYCLNVLLNMISLRDHQTYTMTHDELVWGARMAWRNAARCPARVIWKNLTVFDKRHIDTADEMFQAICDHLEYSNNGGNIRPAITIFRQRIAGKPDPRVWNSLMCQYAGYEMEDGSIMGDPAASGITKVCKALAFEVPILLCVLMF